LSFSKTKVPEPVAALKVKVAVNSTVSPVCQLPATASLAFVWAIMFFSESRSFMGKTPSNIHPAGTSPVILSGLFTFELADGEETTGSSMEGVWDMVRVGVGVGDD